MAVNIPCLIAVIICYLAILAIGIIAARKTQKTGKRDEVMVANRNFGIFVACFTLTATMVGGGYINGTSEAIAWYGLLHTQAPVCYCLGTFLNGLLYAPKLRGESYVTMFDPFQYKYGRKMGALLIIPHLFGDLFWSASILAALGGTVSVIVDINASLSIVISALVAVIYTFLGGLYAVAYTDIIQLIFIAVGLVIACPFAMLNENVQLRNLTDTWVGHVPAGTEWNYLDTVLLLIFGAITWQPMYQRILACKTRKIALIATVVGAVFSFVLAVPAMILGVAGAAADWNNTGYEGPIPIPDDQKAYILPLVLDHLVPLPVSIVGIGAICAAVMSSADSCFLSAATVITKNIYADIIRVKSSDREQLWVLRIMVVFFGTMGTLVAIFSTTIYGLFVLCSDLMYVILFPQLTCVLWLPWSNTYGSLVGFVVAFVLRVLSGEPVLGLPAGIHFPLYDYEYQMQLFPYRTVAMLSGFVCIVAVSALTHHLFTKGLVSVKYDIFGCHRQRTNQARLMKKSDSGSVGLMKNSESGSVPFESANSKDTQFVET